MQRTKNSRKDSETKRPVLRSVDLINTLAKLTYSGVIVVTMSPGQWDKLLNDAYESGAVLLEVDKHERPIAAYQMQET